MVYDLDLDPEAQSSPMESDMMTQVKSLYRMQRHRAPSEMWARRDISILVLDDTDTKLFGYDSDDEESTLNYAIKMSMQQEGDEQSCVEAKPGLTESRPSQVAEEEGTSSATQPQAPENRTNEESEEDYRRVCAVCKSVPQFPEPQATKASRLQATRRAPGKHHATPLPSLRRRFILLAVAQGFLAGYESLVQSARSRWDNTRKQG